MKLKTGLVAGIAAMVISLMGMVSPASANDVSTTTVPTNATSAGTVEAGKTGTDEKITLAEALAMATSSGCGSACDYVDPTKYQYYCGTGCEDNYRCSDDARTIDVVTATSVEMRYSPTCRTVWARWVGSISGSAGITSWYSWTPGVGGTKRAESWGPASLNANYTLMLNDANLCGMAAYSYGPGTSYTMCY